MTIQVPRTDAGSAETFPLYRLTRAVVSAQRPEDIYEAALLCLRDSLGVQHAGLLLADRDGIMRFKAWLELSAGFRAAAEGSSPWQSDASDAVPVVVPDVEAAASVAALLPALTAEGLRSLVYVPLISADHLIGQFVLYYADVRPLADDELLMAQAIAAQVAVAIQQHHAEAERRLSEALLAGQKHALELLASGSALPDVLTSLVAIVEDLSEGDATGSLQLVDSAGRLHSGAAPSLPEAYLAAIDGLPADAAGCTFAACAARGEPVTCRDIAHDAGWGELAALATANGLYAVWSQPIHGREGDVIGVFSTYYREPRVPSASERQIVEVLAQTAAIGIENARAEQAWHAQRAHVEAMFRSAVTGIAEIDPQSRFLAMNDRFCELVGRSREELLTRIDCLSITHPDDRETSQAGMASFADGESFFTQEKRYVRPDGADVWVSNSVTAIRDAIGNLHGAVIVCTDITQRKQSEADLRLSEQRYRALVDAVGLAVYTTDAEGRLTLYNDAAAKLWGREPALGVDLWCGSWRIYTSDGETLALGDCPMAVALQEDRPIRDVELIVERPDGSRANILPYPTPLHDENGRVVGAVNVVVDITARKQAENEVVGRNQLIQSITDNMSVGLIMMDADGGIEYMNPAAEAITGWRFDEVRGGNAHGRFHHHRPDGSAFDADDCAIMQAARTLQPLSRHEDVFVRPDGSFYDVVCNAAPLLRDGVRLGAILDFRDVTIEKRAERALRESENNLREAAIIKDQFLGLVSHELRTPISTILGNGLLLSRRGDQLEREDRDQALLDIVSEAHKLQEIIENLLLLTRLESGQLDLEPLLLHRLLEEATAEFKKLNPDRVVTLDIDDDLPPALGQPTLVTLVLRNLLSNAGKYSAPETPIELRLSADPSGFLRTSVRDHGIGLDTTDLENVFMPFYRSPRARMKAKGMGLGLAVCKRIVEAQAGDITVESQPDEGAVFAFTLQAADGLV